MKNVFYSILLLAGIGFAGMACNKGAYNANTNSNQNLGVNPLTPLTADQFDWAGSSHDPMSATINGVPWAASYATWSLDTKGGNVITGYLGAKKMFLYLNQVYAGNVYDMGYNNFLQAGIWSDSVGAIYENYYSTNGNSGEVYITHNDSASITGLFYFKGASNSGEVVEVTNGYFHLSKI